jgi:homopolymeric O-antigen transport system ATP-binding protein
LSVAEVIRAEGVGKRYRHHGPDRSYTLKETLLHGFRRSQGQHFWALEDVSFSIEEGQTFGVIGPNGAGKSTLLRLMARVERPDRGQIEVRGRLGALLSLGVGFHPELTGRENVLLAGVIAGLARQEIQRRMPDLIAFAELEEFIDSPLRIYSSGMQARLAFSLATHIDPEVLLIDEVLAVGDLAFQQRCVERIKDFQRAGVTIVLVSHSPALIRGLCEEAIWLQGGHIFVRGPVQEILSRYAVASSEMARAATPQDLDVAYTPDGVALRPGENRFGSQEGSLEAVRLTDWLGDPCSEIRPGEGVVLTCDVVPPVGRDAVIGVSILRGDGVVCLETHTLILGGTIRARARLSIERLDLAPGQYSFEVGLYSADWSRTFDFHYGAYRFAVVGQPAGSGALAPPASWRVDAAKAGVEKVPVKARRPRSRGTRA